jgi:hypothetical protein
VSFKTPEQKFKTTVNELYSDKIIAYKKTEDYKKDSTYFYQLYNDMLKNVLTSQKYAEKLNESWEKINVKPPSAFKYYFLARKFRRNGDINNSKFYSDTCIALYPKFAPIYFNLAASDSEKLDFRLENLSKAIELDRDKSRYLFFRSSMYYENNENESAYNDIRKYNEIEINKSNYQSNLFEISILLDLNMRDNGCEKYIKLKKQFEKEFEITKVENPSVVSMIEKICK